MAGSQRVVVHSAIAIVMVGSIAGLWPTAATAEPYHCDGRFSHGGPMPEVYRDCPPQPDAGPVTIVIGPFDRARDHDPRGGRYLDEPWPGRRTRYPPPGRAFRLRPPRLHAVDPAPRGRVDDRPGAIPGEPAGTGGAAPRAHPPEATTGGARTGRPASRGRPGPSPRGVPSSVMLRTATRGGPAAPSATAPRRPVRPGTAVPPRRTGTQARTAPVVTSRRHHPSGARALEPRRRTPKRHDRVVAATRDPHVSQNAFDSRIPQPTATTWTVRRISAGDDGLAALRLGVTVAIGLVIAAGTLLLMRITRVIPLALGDERHGPRRRSAAWYGRRIRAARPAGWRQRRAAARPEGGARPAGAPEARPHARGLRAAPRRPGALLRTLLRRPAATAPAGAEPAAVDAATAASAAAARAAGAAFTGSTPATAPAFPAIAPATPPAVFPAAGTGVFVRLLGEVVIEGPGGRVECVPGKDLADLLGLLAVHRDGLTRERAHELLWPGTGPSDHDRFHARKRELRRRLARALGDPGREAELIRQAGHRYLLNPELVGVDYWRLTDELAIASAADGLRERLAALRRATDLYAGPFLPGGTRPWRAAVADDLRRSVVQALTTLIEHEHDAARLLALLRRALELDPCNEPLRRRQMRLHADLGRVDEAHRSYQALVAALDELGGLRPSPLTTTLYRRLSGRDPE